jgi:hypothetical protein
MGSIHGVRSLASLRSRARVVAFDDATPLVADLADVVKSKTAVQPSETRNQKNEA